MIRPTDLIVARAARRGTVVLADRSDPGKEDP
jgi:hypothetical protein